MDSAGTYAWTHCPVPVLCWGWKEFGHHWFVSILTPFLCVAGLDKMLVISTTFKQEQKVFVVTTETIGSFPTHRALQGARIQVLKY